MGDAKTYRLSRPSANPNDPAVSEAFGLGVLDDLYRGDPELRSERIAIYGRTAQYVLCTPALGVDAADLLGGADVFPYDGASPIAQSGGAGFIQLAADAPSHDLRGAGIILVSGSGAGQARFCAGYNGTSKVFTPGVNFSPAPNGSTHYLIVVPTFWCATVQVRAEFENDAATDPAALVTPLYFDFPFFPPASGDYAGMGGVAAGATARPPIPSPGLDLTMENLDTTYMAVQSGYRLSRTQSENARGGVGMKLWLRTPPTVGRVALWACGT